MRSARILALSTLAALPVFLGGCAPQDDLDEYITQILTRQARHIEALPALKVFERVAYAATDRRDPFSLLDFEQPVPEEVADNGIRPDSDRPRELLESYPLEGMAYRGMVEQRGTTYALIEAPDKVIHALTTGNHLGRNYGRITAIAEARIEILEIIPSPKGGWEERPTRMELRDEGTPTVRNP